MKGDFNGQPGDGYWRDLINEWWIWVGEHDARVTILDGGMTADVVRREDGKHLLVRIEPKALRSTYPTLVADGAHLMGPARDEKTLAWRMLSVLLDEGVATIPEWVDELEFTGDSFIGVEEF
jgi:hypothetical protein